MEALFGIGMEHLTFRVNSKATACVAYSYMCVAPAFRTRVQPEGSLTSISVRSAQA